MIRVKRLVEDAQLPIKAHRTDAGYDLFSAYDYTIPAGERLTIQTGISVELPDQGTKDRDLYLRIAPRSGLAVKNGIHVLAGVVDRGYTGEVQVPLLNTSEEDFIVSKGDRVAQMIPTFIYTGPIVETQELSDSERSENGIGSTGN